MEHKLKQVTKLQIRRNMVAPAGRYASAIWKIHDDYEKYLTKIISEAAARSYAKHFVRAFNSNTLWVESGLPLDSVADINVAAEQVEMLEFEDKRTRTAMKKFLLYLEARKAEVERSAEEKRRLDRRREVVAGTSSSGSRPSSRSPVQASIQPSSSESDNSDDEDQLKEKIR